MVTLIRCKSIVCSFIAKLRLYRQKLNQNDLINFPNLNDANSVSQDEILRYCEHLNNLIEDFEIRFDDLISLNVPIWISQPFTADPMHIKTELQEDLIDLQNDEEAKAMFIGDRYDLFWCKLSDKYPLLWKFVKLHVLSFPTSYLVEKGFSAVTLLLSKQRNRLSITERGDLQLYLTKMVPDVKKLVAQKQPHPSH